MIKLRPTISNMMISVNVLNLSHKKILRLTLKYLTQLDVVYRNDMGNVPCIWFIIKTMVQKCMCVKETLLEMSEVPNGSISKCQS